MNYYEDIKNELINNEINRKVKSYSVNKSDLDTYYNVGKMLSEAGKHYGEGIIKEYSRKLSIDIGKGYGITNLKRMRKFFMIIEKGAAVPHLLSWSHIITILPLDDIDKINYYIKIAELNNYSYRELGRRIKLKEYERLPDYTRNKMISNDKVSIIDLVPDTIIIKGNNEEIYNEKILHKLIVDNILLFMKELGNGFSFIDSEYKIKVDNKFNYIDLLLFNIEFNCYVVIELKVCELRKEHIGQIKSI